VGRAPALSSIQYTQRTYCRNANTQSFDLHTFILILLIVFLYEHQYMLNNHMSTNGCLLFSHARILFVLFSLPLV
jgi:hypothetical protein